MGHGIRSGAVDELELHALVDGFVEEERRTVLHRRLEGAPIDRARVEAWQGQNELLRSTFAGIEREPLPALLDLSPKARLQCIPANDAPLVGSVSSAEPKSARRIRIAAVVATTFVIAVGLGGSWLLLDVPRPEAAATPVALSPAPTVRDGVARLPTTQIPDLAVHGFRFVGAETGTHPTTIQFHYQDGSDRITVSVSQSSTQTGTTAIWTGDGFEWDRDNKTFALTGTPKRDQLLAIAVALQKLSN